MTGLRRDDHVIPARRRLANYRYAVDVVICHDYSQSPSYQSILLLGRAFLKGERFCRVHQMYVFRCTCHRNVYFEFLPPNVIHMDFFGTEVAAQLIKLTNFTTLSLIYVYRGRYQGLYYSLLLGFWQEISCVSKLTILE